MTLGGQGWPGGIDGTGNWSFSATYVPNNVQAVILIGKVETIKDSKLGNDRV